MIKGEIPLINCLPLQHLRSMEWAGNSVLEGSWNNKEATYCCNNSQRGSSTGDEKLQRGQDFLLLKRSRHCCREGAFLPGLLPADGSVARTEVNFICDSHDDYRI